MIQYAKRAGHTVGAQQIVSVPCPLSWRCWIGRVCGGLPGSPWRWPLPEHAGSLCQVCPPCVYSPACVHLCAHPYTHSCAHLGQAIPELGVLTAAGTTLLVPDSPLQPRAGRGTQVSTVPPCTSPPGTVTAPREERKCHTCDLHFLA